MSDIGHSFPGLMIGASLKHSVSQAKPRGAFHFPRSYDRGIIEADNYVASVAKSTGFPRSYDRGIIEAGKIWPNARIAGAFPRSYDRSHQRETGLVVQMDIANAAMKTEVSRSIFRFKAENSLFACLVSLVDQIANHLHRQAGRALGVVHPDALLFSDILSDFERTQYNSAIHGFNL